jgi:cytochrome c oxidase cbb3-type subunit 3
MSFRCREGETGRGKADAGEASKRNSREGVILRAAKNLSAVLLVLLGLACKREQRNFQGIPRAAAAGIPAVREVDLVAGGPVRHDTVPGPYEGNAYAVSQGKTLYNQYNCTGCHFQGGGGIGPPLMDAEWIYGSTPANIYETIAEGRPNGMPSFGGKIVADQIWQIVAYVRSMSGLLRKDVAPGRSDDMQVRPQEQSTEKPRPASR